MKYGIPIARILFLLLLAPSSLPAAPPDDRVGPAVHQRLAEAGAARVMIYLAAPAVASGNREALSREAARAQQPVLQALGRHEFRPVHVFDSIPALAGEINRPGLEKLLQLPGVLRVDIDEGGAGTLAQAVPLTNTDLVQAAGVTGKGVTVAILDSGIDRTHADLSGDLVGEACFCSGGGGCCPDGTANQLGPGSGQDDNGHGTNVTGIVTATGTVSSIGVAPDADIVAIKVLDSSNSFCCSSDVIAGLNWILANRPDVDIVNMSLGTFALFNGNCDNAAGFTMAFAAAINALRANGVTTFVSSGNNGSGTQMSVPACIANSLSVGAVWDSNVGPQGVFCFEPTTATDQVTCFSNSNGTTDLFAPGAPITSSGLGGGTSTYFGTSQASPHAAGCAADLLEAFPALTPNEIEATLESTGVPVIDATNGLSFPRVDCRTALDSLAVCDPDPASQGWWHRQCLGAGLIAPGRNGRGNGPKTVLEPDFLKNLVPAVDLRLQNASLGFRTCEDGMDAEPPNDPCQRALKQTTALLLNLESGRLQTGCRIDLGGESCDSASVGELLQELAVLIQSRDPDLCKQAASCASAVNENQGVVFPAASFLPADSDPGNPGTEGPGDGPRAIAPPAATVRVRPSGETAAAPQVIPTAPGWVPTGAGGPIRAPGVEPVRDGSVEPPEDGDGLERHMKVVTDPGAPETARMESERILLTLLGGGHDPGTRARIASVLIDRVDVGLHSLLVRHLEDIRLEAEEAGNAAVVKESERLLERLVPPDAGAR